MRINYVNTRYYNNKCVFIKVSSLLNKKLQSSSKNQTKVVSQKVSSSVKSEVEAAVHQVAAQAPTPALPTSQPIAPASYLSTLLSNPGPILTPPPSSSSPHTPHWPSSAAAAAHSTNSSSSSSSSTGGQVACTSLWVGNVDSSVTEEMLIELFAPHGHLTNVRCLPEKYCAFVNYKTKEEAGRAMSALQGKQLEGQRLLIKYPDNPNTFVITNIVKTGNKL